MFLFDYRVSMELPDATVTAGAAYTLDAVATLDWPAAVSVVLKTSGAKQTDVVAHCVGSTTFIMSRLAGHLEGRIR